MLHRSKNKDALPMSGDLNPHSLEMIMIWVSYARVKDYYYLK
jgi:hypothetical protein